MLPRHHQHSIEPPDPWPPPFSSLFVEFVLSDLANCSSITLLRSQLVRFFVNFADLRSRKFMCELTLFPPSPLPALPWVCSLWLVHSRIEVSAGPLKCSPLASCCLLARIWFSFSIVCFAPQPLSTLCTVQVCLCYSLFFCSSP